jgi:signal transduction histidine kinase/CheY-like chemotaxis protein
MLESDIFRLLDVAVFERTDTKKFLQCGQPPQWWLQFAPNFVDDVEFDFLGLHPFLDNFLVDAEQVWDSTQPARVSSGIWQFNDNQGKEFLFESFALTDGVRKALAFREYSQAAERNSIQQGRGIKLERLRDAARRSQLEIELQAARVSADQLARAKSEFVATVSHEMRTPLTSILGLAELLGESKLSEGQQTNLQELKAAAKSMLGIVGNLLDVARLESGSIVAQHCEFQLRELTDELVANFAEAAKERNLEFKIIVPDDVPESLVSDLPLLRQALNNLVDNAIRFTNDGHVAMELKFVKSDDADLVEFAIRDTGIGISDALQSKVMEMFQQADSAITRRYGGVGLGLTIAQRLIRAVGGNLELSSTPGVGSQFRFSLPTSPKALDENRTNSPSSYEPEKFRILVAEDNRVNRQFLIHILEKNGHFVDWVENGQEVIDFLETHDVDVILMDCQMPIMSGYDASKAIRKIESTNGAYLPIIAVTANAMPENEARCRDAGMDFFISKPFQTKHLLALIQEAARRRLRPEQSASTQK